MSPATSFVRPPWATPTASSSVLVSGPTEEPVSLDDAKLAAGLAWPTGDPRDAQMRGFIAAARAQVEHDTGYALLTQIRDVSIAPRDDDAFVLPVQAYPVQSISTIDGQLVDPAFFSVERSSRTLRSALLTTGGTWRITAGWPDAVALAAEAPLLVQAVKLLVAHYATVGRDLAITGTIVNPTPMGYDAAIGPYRLVQVI